MKLEYNALHGDFKFACFSLRVCIPKSWQIVWFGGFTVDGLYFEDRHDLIFPLFEFEMHGGMEDLIAMEKELLVHLGYDASKFVRGKYTDVANKYDVIELEHEHETRMYEDSDGTPSFFLTDFPELTSPFWKIGRASCRERV